MTPGRSSLEPAPSSRPEAGGQVQLSDVGELLTFTDRLFRADTLSEASEAALDTICDLMACRKAAVLKFDPAGVMRFIAWRGLGDAYRAAAEGHTPWARGAVKAAPIVLADLAQLDDAALSAAAQAEGVAALAFIPIWGGGEVIGKFMVYYTQPRELSEDELALATFIARQLGFCIERLSAQEDLRRRARHLAELNGLSRKLASGLNDAAIVKTAIGAAVALAEADWGLFVGAGDSIRAAAGDAPGDLAQLSGPLRADLAAALTGSDLIRRLKEPASRNPRHALIAPVVLRSGTPYGAFVLARHYDAPFVPEHEILMASLASHAALAVENAALLAAAEQAAETHRAAGETAARLAAIVESSEDAILGKSLDGILTSWNAGAERLLGYTAEEIVGRPVMLLIPPDRVEEEARILEQIRSGVRVAPFETARMHKNGEPVEVSLSVSPVRDAAGRLVGASTIARDMSERRRAEARQKLLIREMDHRIKNLFTLASGLVSVSARSASDPKALAMSLRRRLTALADAHSLTLPQGDGAQPPSTSLHALLQRVLAPYQHDAEASVQLSGDDVALNPGAVTALALLVYELATNAAKYGPLGRAGGRVNIRSERAKDVLTLAWTETGGPPATPPTHEGFGSTLTRATIEHQLGGAFERVWSPTGLAVIMTLPLDRLA